MINGSRSKLYRARRIITAICRSFSCRPRFSHAVNKLVQLIFSNLALGEAALQTY
jgi:hypothetical protein